MNIIFGYIYTSIKSSEEVTLLNLIKKNKQTDEHN